LNVTIGGMMLSGEIRSSLVAGQRVPVPLCPSQNLHGLVWDTTRASAVKDLRLTVWSMTRPT